MTRACGALSLEEEKHLLLAKAHSALAAKCRIDFVEETREAVKEAWKRSAEAKKELLEHILHASTELLEDKETMLVLLRVVGSALHRCRPDLRSDPEMILAACHGNGSVLGLVGPDVQADRGFVLEAVRLNGAVLQGASPDLRGDREVVLAAVQSEPFALQFACDELRYDRSMVLAALRQQTRRRFFVADVNVLRAAFQDEVSDRELLLEAARVDGAIVERASLQLRQDKDFLLQVMRVTPREDLEVCYAKAAGSVRATTSLEDFENACDSALAGPGEVAPVLTVTLPFTDSNSKLQESERHSQHSFPTSCEVTLLSGSSFTCSLLGEARASSSSGPSSSLPPASAFPASSNRNEANLNDLGPAGLELCGQQASPTFLTVGELAERFRVELPEKTKALGRIFIVFPSRNDKGESASIRASAWDWNAPVTDFLF